ncbi:hypothetical protein BV898_15123 [Hypsibius exemplaris]|uniref:Receptor ligand binding region domain-containing protein n=1 Tax=Hypsibius exemplaris TaxID=2072580 RepID=A0A9X6NA52_HYPEX|nr:hypothetical protein BV898_15123 [Hypsibius exemplaris]
MYPQSGIVFIIIACHQYVATVKRVVFIISLPYNTGTSLDVSLVGPAVDLAAERINRDSGSRLNVSIHYFYNISHRTCSEPSAETSDKIAKFYQDEIASSGNSCYAVVSNNCDDMTGIKSLVREYDWTLLTNVFTSNDFWGSPQTRSSFPAVATGGTNKGYARAVLDVLQHYKWFHAAVLLETKAGAPFYRDVGNVLRETAPASFNLHYYLIERIFDETLSDFLQTAKTRSRVIILLTLGSTALQLLVFLNLQALQDEVAYGAVTQFSLANADDSNLLAFRSLLFITYRSQGKNLNQFNKDIAERTRSTYNITYKPGIQPFDNKVLRSSFDLVELFAKVVNESDTANGCSGLQIVHAMTNRTFALSTGNIYIDAERSRDLDLDIFGFNTSTREMQIIGTYEWARSSHLGWFIERSVEWPTMDSQPPLDIPVCGFSGDEGPCAVQSTIVTLIAPLAAFMAAILLAVIVILTRWRKSWLTENWWFVDSYRLHIPPPDVFEV